MVCSRCKMVVKTELEKVGMHPLSVELGEVEVNEEPDKNAMRQLNDNLKLLGFEIIDDRKSRVIEQIKNAVIST
jgi:copper chaperone CopZ